MRKINLNFIQKFMLGLLLIMCFMPMTAIALPDIPSFMDCADIIYNSGFQNDSQASNGSGGSYPGSFTRSVTVNGTLKQYYISIPPNYNPSKAYPLLFSWHGAGGAGTATANAIATRDFWKPFADSNNLIIVAQTGNGTNGGGFAFPNDITLIGIILNDMYSAYNIEKARIYGHGFSSGGHLMHTLMLFYHANRFAAYSVSAGNFSDAQFEDPNVPANSDIIPVFVSIGNTDTMLNTILSERIKFLNAGWVENKNYWLDQFNGGHQLDSLIPEKSWEKLCTFSKLSQ